MRTQTIVWTALPNGLASPTSVNLSVFVSPQLQTNEGGAHPTLSLFPDFVNWPKTVLNPKITFLVTFEGHGSVLVSPTPPVSVADWSSIFDPHGTGVTSYVYEDFSTTPIHSFDVNTVEATVSSLYGKLGVSNPTTPPVLTTTRGRFTGPPVYTELTGIASSPTGGGSAISAVHAYHTRPAMPETPYVPTVPTLDFHQAVSSVGSFPAVLRDLGLAFDLVVPIPAGVPATVNVSVTPTFTTAFTGEAATANQWRNINVSPMTNCHLDKASFRSIPVGPDYSNGMLDLADTSRFSVVDLDVDGAAEQLLNLSAALENIGAWVKPEQVDGQTMAMTVPALRSAGPSIVWKGWSSTGSGLNALAARQTKIASEVQAWVTWYLKANPKPAAPALPLLQSEDIIRGHRIDVLSVSEPGTPWHSLHQRVGRYVFGNETPVALPVGPQPGLDEGTLVPGASAAAGTVNPAPPDLYLNESIARWAGWSLAAPRPGPQIDPSDHVHANRQNPAATTPNAAGQITPQLSASFTVAPNTLPKLRFGGQYRYRARAVDLAGNSLPVTSTDATTATASATHLRYEPVASPVFAQIAPLGPGEATMLLAILNYQAEPAATPNLNGRWLFPPKASELLAEEHGMLDGFVAGSAPNPLLRPNPNNATYTMLAGSTPGTPGRVDSTFEQLASANFDMNNNGSTYIPDTALPTTPWLPDPLSSGVSLSGFPNAPTNAVRPWGGGAWPGAEPLLLLLGAGPAVQHGYFARTANRTAFEAVTLPPAAVLDLTISSALTSPNDLAVWSWIEAQATNAFQRAELLQLAEQGQLWLLTPYRVLRLVHAVRLPLVAPVMAKPVVTRTLGSVQASILDASFVYDAPSSSEIDALAVWIDPVDDPSDPTNDPTTATVTNMGHAFKAHVPDPGPLVATARPMEVISPLEEFALTSQPGVVHNIGDTLHHLVNYTCTAPSRFAEFFKVSTTITLLGTTAQPVGTLGLDPGSVVIEYAGSELVQSPDGVTGDYVVDGPDGTIALLPGSVAQFGGESMMLTYVPTDTVTGAAFPVQILSTARPKAPLVVKVTPAWLNEGPNGSLGGGVNYQRIGGYIRVYLDRPWYSTGSGELLGVVGLGPSLGGGSTLPASVSPNLVTMMGLDPISVSSLDSIFPVAPTQFGALTTVPSVPYRPSYSSPPSLPLVESPSGPAMQIWPYAVNFDPVSNYWYADVNISVSSGIDGPPPGHFVRLALVRFQPYSIGGAEISSVALATFAQPVPDRFVSVTSYAPDQTKSSVVVTVSGPGYYGWRPPDTKSDTIENDYYNLYAPHPYTENGANGGRSSSTMVVEVQIQNPDSPLLTGDLGWAPAPGFPPVMLMQSFAGSDEVNWSLSTVGGSPAPILLPAAIGSSTPMRLRISELDYYPFLGEEDTLVPPTAVNTSYRRPFVAFIPIN